jgi:hypothetical protein
MVATTAIGTWVVPRGYALWLLPGVVHDVAMHGAVSMRTAYVLLENTDDLPSSCEVIDVPPLLEAALVALCAEPPAYYGAVAISPPSSWTRSPVRQQRPLCFPSRPTEGLQGSRAD